MLNQIARYIGDSIIEIHCMQRCSLFSADLAAYRTDVGVNVLLYFPSYLFILTSSQPWGRKAAGKERSFRASQLAVEVNGKMSKRQNAKYIFLENIY